jgi:hemerythrin-like domain-containing protein
VPATPAPATPAGLPIQDGFEFLDACHRQMLFALGKLSALVTRLASVGPDDEARAIAKEVHEFFDTTVRRHHEDEERHVFPPLIAAGVPETVQTVLRLQQDHNWLEEDWMDLQPQIAAVAAGQSWCNLDVLRDGTAVFHALLIEHLALEESIIYPQARDRLREPARRQMAREMVARRRDEHRRGRGRAP